uniref:Uncharacterized protein n=1 Tax=Kalanchoe fedtschenkoi TaxID=63787 RepID=A0A7N0T006_KALFE
MRALYFTGKKMEGLSRILVLLLSLRSQPTYFSLHSKFLSFLQLSLPSLISLPHLCLNPHSSSWPPPLLSRDPRLRQQTCNLLQTHGLLSMYCTIL